MRKIPNEKENMKKKQYEENPETKAEYKKANMTKILNQKENIKKKKTRMRKILKQKENMKK